MASDARASGKKSEEAPPATPGTKGDGGKGKSKGKGKESGKKGEGKDGKGKSKGKGKDKGKDKGKKGEGKSWADKLDTTPLLTAGGKRICVFHQVGNCNDAKCQYAHEMCSTPEQKALAQKVRERVTAARSATPKKTPGAPATQQGEGEGRRRRRRGRSSSRGAPSQQ